MTTKQFMKEAQENIRKRHKMKVNARKAFLEALIKQLHSLMLFESYREKIEEEYGEDFADEHFDEFCELFDKIVKEKTKQATEEKDGLY